jgi:hypothetical protein
MTKIDYKIFVPRGENNYVRFDSEEIEITEILTINIHLGDDKVIYWLYFKISKDDDHHNVLLQPGKKPGMMLLIGNNPYEIHGMAEVIRNELYKWEEKRQITICFTVSNASKTSNNPRKNIIYDRFELLDLSSDK